MADTVSQDQINELLRTMQVQKAAKQESGRLNTASTIFTAQGNSQRTR